MPTTAPAASKRPVPHFDPQRLYTIREIAQAFGVSRFTVYAWLRNKQLQHSPPTRREICVEGGVLQQFKRPDRGVTFRRRRAAREKSPGGI